MSNWALTAGLQNLRQQVNERWPERDHESDGTIGDAEHQAETSGHNRDDVPGSRAAWNSDPDDTPEVRAWDMDSDLREPGASAQALVDHIRKLPGVAGVIRYMIFNRRMYHYSNGFSPTAYDGPSPHTEHVHFEGAWSQAADNNTTFDYRLEDLNMPTPDEYAQAVANKLYADVQNSKSGLGIWANARQNAVLGAVGEVRTEVAALAQPTITLTTEQVERIGAILAQATGGAVADLSERLKAAGLALAQ